MSLASSGCRLNMISWLALELRSFNYATWLGNGRLISIDMQPDFPVDRHYVLKLIENYVVDFCFDYINRWPTFSDGVLSRSFSNISDHQLRVWKDLCGTKRWSFMVHKWSWWQLKHEKVQSSFSSAGNMMSIPSGYIHHRCSKTWNYKWRFTCRVFYTKIVENNSRTIELRL